mgnify:FL=1
MPESRWGPASSFIVQGFHSGVGADRLARALRGTDVSLTRAEVRDAYRTLRGEGVMQDAIGRLRGNVALPEWAIAQGAPNQRDPYRYNIAMTTEQVITRPDGTEYTVSKVSYRSIGFDERVSKQQAIDEFLALHAEALEDYRIKVSNPTVTNVYRK